MRNFATFAVVLALVSLSACSGKPVVEKLYKPGADNVFRTEGKDEQACYKNAREHCKGDFEVMKKDSREEGDEQLETLEFRCI